MKKENLDSLFMPSLILICRQKKKKKQNNQETNVFPRSRSSNERLCNKFMSKLESFLDNADTHWEFCELKSSRNKNKTQLQDLHSDFSLFFFFCCCFSFFYLIDAIVLRSPAAACGDMGAKKGKRGMEEVWRHGGSSYLWLVTLILPSH